MLTEAGIETESERTAMTYRTGSSLINHQHWRNGEDDWLDFPGTIYSASTWIVPILIAITFHEAAHAYAAWKLGDDTALPSGPRHI